MQRSCTALILTMGFILAPFGRASADAIPDPTLQSTMKRIGQLNKQIKGALADATQNSANAAAALEMNGLFHRALTFTPDSVQQMPPESQAAAMIDYRALINDEIASCERLEAAFERNDNAGAAPIFEAMGMTKKDGHARFDP